jgi:hypothetical protein
MELEKLALLIAEEFVSVFVEAFDQLTEPEDEDESVPKVMTAGRR